MAYETTSLPSPFVLVQGREGSSDTTANCIFTGRQISPTMSDVLSALTLDYPIERRASPDWTRFSEMSLRQLLSIPGTASAKATTRTRWEQLQKYAGTTILTRTKIRLPDISTDVWRSRTFAFVETGGMMTRVGF